MPSFETARASKGSIRIVDDEEAIRESLETLLELEGYSVTLAEDALAGIDALGRAAFDLVLLDLNLPDRSGLEVVEEIRQTDKETPVILLTAYGSVENAVAAIKRGANDFFTKPWNNEKLLIELERTIAQRRLQVENIALRETLRERYSFSNIIGKSARMRQVFEIVGQVSPTRSNILIRGDSGTGKDLIAKAIHAISPRNGMPFVAITTVSIPVDLLESKLFGHVRGAFSGAPYRN
jgi:DNA-binding NtrC family response regulator